MPFATDLRVPQHRHFDLLDAVSSRWAILVIRQLNGRTMSVDELCQRMQSVPRHVIQSTMNHLQREGVVTAMSNGRSREEDTVYSLTEVGISAIRPISALHAWALTHYEDARSLAQAEISATRFFMMHNGRERARKTASSA